MQRLIDNLIKDEKLAKTISVHNLTALTSLEKPTVITCMWPTPDRGYTAKHLLKYWERLRKACYYDSTGNVRKTPLNLIGYSTDSSGFSLAAAVQLMTPTAYGIQNVCVALLLASSSHRILGLRSRAKIVFKEFKIRDS